MSHASDSPRNLERATAPATRARLAEHAARVDTELRAALAHHEGTLGAVARELVLGGGKRVRPILCLESCLAVGGAPEAALGLAVAVELVHAMSLVHDDLPSMDDNLLRRGLPACHVAHGEAVAILVGDALLAFAFGALARSIPSARADVGLALVTALSEAAGFGGMASAQAAELTGSSGASPADVARIADGKTGALFALAASGGARLGGGTAAEIEALTRFGVLLGRAFQAIDDLLDSAPPSVTGKSPGNDASRDRPTTVVCFGPAHARAVALQELANAEETLTVLGDRADGLASLLDGLHALASENHA